MENNVKQIICYRGDRSACHFYRIHAPFGTVSKHCNDKFRITVQGYIDSSHLEDSKTGKCPFDIAIFQRQYGPKVFEAMQVMKAKGAKIIYEIDDDLFNIPEWNPAHKELNRKGVQDNLRQFLLASDALFTTNDYLASVYSPYCRNTFVLPNSLVYTHFSPSPGIAAKPVVCWQGSATHDRDVSLMASAVKRIAEDKKAFVKMWSYDIPGTYKVPPVPFEAFYAMLSQIDGKIGLAPLTFVPFNKSKSNLKFLEYTAQGMVTIASNFGPYKDTITDGENGILITDNRDWYDAINTLLDDDTLYNKLLGNAQKFVKENYDIEKNYVMWVDAMNQVLEG